MTTYRLNWLLPHGAHYQQRQQQEQQADDDFIDSLKESLHKQMDVEEQQEILRQYKHQASVMIQHHHFQQAALKQYYHRQLIMLQQQLVSWLVCGCFEPVAWQNIVMILLFSFMGFTSTAISSRLRLGNSRGGGPTSKEHLVKPPRAIRLLPTTMPPDHRCH